MGIGHARDILKSYDFSALNIFFFCIQGPHQIVLTRLFIERVGPLKSSAFSALYTHTHLAS